MNPNGNRQLYPPSWSSSSARGSDLGDKEEVLIQV